MSTYLQVPATTTEPLLAIMDRRIEELSIVSRGRFMMAATMFLLAQDDKVILDMMTLASSNMTLCRKT